MEIAIIDANHILYYFNNGPKKLDADGIPIKVDNKFVYEEQTEEGLYRDIDAYLSQVLSSSKAKQYIGILDSGKPSFRAKYESYKENRKDKTPPKFGALATKYLIDTYEFIKAPDGYEADDVVASLLKALPNSFIVSPDKDLLNLEGTHFNPKTLEFNPISKDQAEYYFWSSMICGDTADNIKGLPGKGPAFVKKLFTKYDPLEGGYSSLVLNSYIEQLGNDEGVEEFGKNYELLRIVDDVDVTDYSQFIRTV